jgi:arsenical pump membrane protein
MLRRFRAGGFSPALALAGCIAAAVAVAVSSHDARAAADQAWPPFVLVSGLLMVGVVAHRDGLFDALGTRAARLRAHPAVLLLGLLGVVAAVTIVLNLDTAVAFLTPVLVLAARVAGVDEEAFLYGTLFMANSASLVLPGSNLTNLLVLAHEHVAGWVFATRMWPASLPPILVTAAFVVVIHRHRLAGRDGPTVLTPQTLRPTWSTLGVAAAAVAILALSSPAVAVLVIGVALVVHAMARRAVSAHEVGAALQPAALLGLFGLAVALGTLARAWNGPAHLVAHANGPETAALGAVTAVAVNNLPAAVLLSARSAVHTRALLIGLNLGPNLAVTGSLSSLIWFRAARAVGAKPSVGRVSRLGAVLVPISIAAAVSMVWLVSPARL